MICNRNRAQVWEQFTIVDDGGGHVPLQIMSKYVSSEIGVNLITYNQTVISDWKKFDWVAAANEKIALCDNNGKFISSENGAQAMTCTHTSVGEWKEFAIN